MVTERGTGVYSTAQLSSSSSSSWQLVATLPETGPDLAVSKRVSRHIVLANDNEKDKNSNFNPLEHCNVTAQVKIFRPIVENENIGNAASSSSSSNWWLQSFDPAGTPKTVGGDEFYVTYTTRTTNESSSSSSDKMLTLVAYVTDNNDGTYGLDFWTTPLYEHKQQQLEENEHAKNEGTLTVAFQYTCGIGKLHPPLKEHWKSAATSQAVHRTPESTNVPLPPFQRFQAPNKAGSSTNNIINLGQYEHVIAYGDSLMEGFVRGKGRDARFRREQGTFFQPNVVWRDNPQLPLNLATLDRHLELVEEWHGDMLRTRKQDDNSQMGAAIALMLGSAAWDLLYDQNRTTSSKPFFKDHLTAVEQLLRTLQQRYPAVHLYWKSPAALHSHALAPACFQYKRKCQHQTKYLAASRSSELQQQQRDLIRRLNIPNDSQANESTPAAATVTYLDMYDAYYLSADSTLPGDGRHYAAELDQVLFNGFYLDAPSDTAALSPS